MTDITVRALGEQDWQIYRDVRLAALSDSPDAFAASVAQERQFDDAFWRRRLVRSRRLIAERGDDVVGVVSVGRSPAEDPRSCELFGLWVKPDLRGQGVAWRLVQAGVEQAGTDSFQFVVYWVGTDNGRGVAFASSFGFRPTDARRPMKVTGVPEGTPSTQEEPDVPEDEMAMVYSLGEDPGSVPSSVL
ncbi:N-acetyltransferase [Allobranchiibius sp. GilTou73]|uniref:GNAT family N-acetyltransferase n=1 Tax=Allobranchiibius sp. GilTou73 TaxID=2904523 RepID=UPI001F3DA0D5|nr:GNAT family N-acetyltransferase [Allobranchiibius sp. GilTou73]UIJ35003.1 GNAT family N-acetyltransferase [Allobranchiibius sp. GilTou73]